MHAPAGPNTPQCPPPDKMYTAVENAVFLNKDLQILLRVSPGLQAAPWGRESRHRPQPHSNTGVISADDSPPKIIPLNYYDGNLLMKTMLCRAMFVFDSALNPEKLRSGLCTLAEKEGWEKIGARLRCRWNGQLEYHIPSKFTALQPAIMFSQERYAMDMKNHPIASQIPVPGPAEQPSVIADSEAFRSLLNHQNAPKTVREYVGADIPQVALHVVAFSDATVISISWPHTFADGMGMMGLIQAWTLVLEDPEARVPPPHEIESNPLKTLRQNPTEPYKWLDRQMSNWQKLKYACRRLPGYLLHPRVNRVVCVPSSFIASLREEALKDIRNLQSPTAPFVSENDVLFAWWARLVFSHTPRNLNQTLNLFTTVSRRGALSKDLLPPDAIYLSNAIGVVQTLMTKKDLLKEPLGYAAYRIRQTILGDNTREQIEAQEALSANSILGLPSLLGDSSMEALLSTSMIKGNMYDLNFSCAARKDKLSDPNSAIKPYYIQPFLSVGAYDLLTLVVRVAASLPGLFWYFSTGIDSKRKSVTGLSRLETLVESPLRLRRGNECATGGSSRESSFRAYNMSPAQGGHYWVVFTEVNSVDIWWESPGPSG
ncbi:hypothetical protein V502_02936 [Pseudogymnoascus sp. VKM F-4520 (FW-2644)]|nr:hypothetical protein V502_02936 [Pseudogymnoascus sp. VKM F-4520 (FW-2644)]